LRISDRYPLFAAEALSFSGNWKVWDKYPGAYFRVNETEPKPKEAKVLCWYGKHGRNKRFTDLRLGWEL
jgi:hypothetical protein